jgi:hypothetical protein
MQSKGKYSAALRYSSLLNIWTISLANRENSVVTKSNTIEIIANKVDASFIKFEDW